MIEQSTFRHNYLGSTVFMMQFFLFICNFNKSSDKQTGRASRYELITDLRSNAAAINDVQQLHGQKCTINIINKTNLKFLHSFLNRISENRQLNQKITFLQMTEHLIKPLLLHRFYYQYHYPAAEDLPHLS